MAKRAKYLAFILLVAAFVGGRSVFAAAYFDCFGSTMQYWYYGSEVECSESYKQNLCEAACAYCFSTGCHHYWLCTAGEDAGGFCTNGGL